MSDRDALENAIVNAKDIRGEATFRDGYLSVPADTLHLWADAILTALAAENLTLAPLGTVAALREALVRVRDWLSFGRLDGWVQEHDEAKRVLAADPAAPAAPARIEQRERERVRARLYAQAGPLLGAARYGDPKLGDDHATHHLTAFLNEVDRILDRIAESARPAKEPE